MSIKSQTGTAVTAVFFRGLLGVHGSLGEGDFHNPELTAILSLSFVDVFSIFLFEIPHFNIRRLEASRASFPCLISWL